MSNLLVACTVDSVLQNFVASFRSKTDPPPHPPPHLLRTQVAGTGPGGVEFVAVAAGRYHSVGLSAEGIVHTWGLNDWGQLGRPGIRQVSWRVNHRRTEKEEWNLCPY